MSIKAINWVFSLPLPPFSKLVMLAVADYADEAGVCWPSTRQVAAKASVSERTARYTLQACREIGLIAGGGTRGASSEMRLDMSASTLTDDQIHRVNEITSRHKSSARRADVESKSSAPHDHSSAHGADLREQSSAPCVKSSAPHDKKFGTIARAYIDNHQEPSGTVSHARVCEPARAREVPDVAAAAAEVIDPKKSEPDHAAKIEGAWRPLAVRCEQIAGLDRPGRFAGTAVLGVVRQWMVDAVKMGLSPAEAGCLIIEVVERISGRPNFSCHSLGYFSQPVAKALCEAQERKKFEAIQAPGEEFEITVEERLAYLAYSRGWRSYDPDAVIEPWRTWIQNRRLAHVAA